MALAALRVRAADEAELHLVGFGEYGLGGPARELAGVVLHFCGDDGAALRGEFGAPVERAACALGFVVEFVEGFDGQVLVFAGDVVLDHGVELGAHDQVQGFFVGAEREVEAAVFVALAGEVVRGVVGMEGVGVLEVEFVVGGGAHDLHGEEVVDGLGFLGEVEGGVDAVGFDAGLVLLWGGAGVGFEGGVGGVFVDGDEIDGGVDALVEEDLVVVLEDHNVPRVDGAGGAHEHGEDVGCGEDGGFVLIREILDDGVGGCGDVVCCAIDGLLQLALGVLDGWLIIGAVVVVEETILIHVFTF